METLQIENHIPLFSRGSDIYLLQVYKKIYSKDKYTVWYTNDFKEISKWKLRKILIKLEKLGYIKKIKSYPIYWMRSDGLSTITTSQIKSKIEVLI